MASPAETNASASTNGTQKSPFLTDWGFTLKDLYNLSLNFYKEKQGKAMHISYEDRLKLAALSCQVLNGKFNSETASPVGVLDMIGKDRRLAWQTLGEKSKADCMYDYITTINKQSPQFKPYVEAHKRDIEEKLRNQELEEENVLLQNEEYRITKELEKQAEENQRQVEEQKRRIQDALNRQTFAQFKVYAEQQYPGNPEQQGVLIRQLQEQHYEQYMRQLYQQQQYLAQMQQQKSQSEEPSANISNNNHTSVVAEAQLLSEGLKAMHPGDSDSQTNSVNINQNSNDSKEEKDEDSEDEGSSNNVVAAASMWTRKDIKEFKESVRAEGGEAVIRIGQGESVTVRVPTHPEGSCLFWEFATDSYDLGFGLFFEWTNTDEQVSVQVTEETSEDDEEDDETFQALQQDLEKGRELLPKGARPNTDVIIPVYRRDAHQEVYVGSHIFPGKGVYLLKFDNSYSFWRSKTLYYRVYYTK